MHEAKRAARRHGIKFRKRVCDDCVWRCRRICRRPRRSWRRPSANAVWPFARADVASHTPSALPPPYHLSCRGRGSRPEGRAATDSDCFLQIQCNTIRDSEFRDVVVRVVSSSSVRAYEFDFRSRLRTSELFLVFVFVFFVFPTAFNATSARTHGPHTHCRQSRPSEQWRRSKTYSSDAVSRALLR